MIITKTIVITVELITVIVAIIVIKDISQFNNKENNEEEEEGDDDNHVHNLAKSTSYCTGKMSVLKG